MKPSLLIAEADSVLRSVYGEFFSRSGFDVDTAADGIECLAKLRMTCPDVLIADLEMPWGGADGVVACLQQEGLFRHSPGAVFLTGDQSPAELARLTGTPAEHCVQKPFRLKALLDVIRSATLDHLCSAGPVPGNCG